MASVAGRPTPTTPGTSTVAKERLFANPLRANSYAAGGASQVSDAISGLLKRIKAGLPLSKNQQQIYNTLNPGVKYTPGKRAATQTSLGGMPSYVPAAYQGWVSSASTSTGIPVSVVAAQINMESGFDPNAVSPTGAQGIAQFEPGTWASNAPKNSSPFDTTASLAAYEKLMGSLVTQYHGNIRNALAAYNAGPGNLQAGYGYADSILAAAGAPRTASSGSPSTFGGTRPGGQPSTSSSSGGSGGDDGGAAVSQVFDNYQAEITLPRTAPASTFTSPKQAGVSAPFQWWWQSFTGAYAQEENSGN